MAPLRERRRLALVARHAMLAKFERREAVNALASAVEEEARSKALARRSRELLRNYADQTVVRDAAALKQNAAFIASLDHIAGHADIASRDAREQAEWHVQNLASADTKASRLEERRAEAERSLRTAMERREAPVPQGMARKLQHDEMQAATTRPAQRSRN